MYKNENFVTDTSKLLMEPDVRYHKFLLTIKPGTGDKTIAKISTMLRLKFSDTPQGGQIIFKLNNIEKVSKKLEIILELSTNLNWNEIGESLNYLKEITSILHIVESSIDSVKTLQDNNFGMLVN